MRDSLPYLVIVVLCTIAIGGMLWFALDAGATVIVEQDTWQPDDAPDEIAGDIHAGQSYVSGLWRLGPVMLLGSVVATLLIKSRRANP